MSIMHDLYFGNLVPWERGQPKNPNYKPIARKASEIKEHFNNTLSSEDKKRFEEMQNLVSQYGTMEEVHIFEYAFSMGALMMIDVFNFKEERITDLKEE